MNRQTPLAALTIMFVRLLPMISIAEMRMMLPGANHDVAHNKEGEDL